MSGGGGEGEIEINMTPLLDLVLQLVMFFMLVANFIMEDLNEGVKLPKATTAASLDKSETDVLFLNVDDKGRLLPTDGDRQPIAAPQSINQYLRARYNTRVEGAADRETGKKNARKMLIIIRAHENANFEAVFNIMRACKTVGFERRQLRAYAPDRTLAAGFH